MLGLQTALALAIGRARPARGPGAGPAELAAGAPSPASTRRTAGARAVRSCRGPPPTCASSTPRPRWTVDPAALASRSRNSPYAGRTLTGQVRHTVFRGEPVVVDAEAQR